MVPDPAPASAPAASAGANGVLPTPASILQRNAPTTAPRGGPKSTPPKPKLKFVIRRLPPGLTKAEAEDALGAEWKVGAGKVDWASYRKGKISIEASKASKPGRYFLHLTDTAHVKLLSEKVKQTSFKDSRNTGNDPVLIGAPSLEYALYPRTPGGRRVRHDARQGQIDQDPEYQDFLMGLTDPVSKAAALDSAESHPQKLEKVSTTPLIEAIREKKAAKDKTGGKGVGKHGRGESKEEKADKKPTLKPTKEGASLEKGKKLSRKEAAKEAVKLLNKDASQSTPEKSENVPPTGPSVERKRERGSTAAAKALLQRDLGIGPAAAKGRRGTKKDAAPENEAKVTEGVTPAQGKEKTIGGDSSSSVKASASPETSRSAKKESRFSKAERRAHKASVVEKKDGDAAVEDKPKAPIAPTILRKPATETPNPASPASAPKAPATAPKGPAATRQTVPPSLASTVLGAHSASTTPQPSKQAFLKHANPSQGITEPLIEEALSAFGTIEKVEIDKRKGFAYVEFADAEGLQKAIAASPVKIAQGAVQVLERKDRAPRKERMAPMPVPAAPPTAPRGGRGGGFAGRGRGGARGGAGPAGRGRLAQGLTPGGPFDTQVGNISIPTGPAAASGNTSKTTNSAPPTTSSVDHTT